MRTGTHSLVLGMLIIGGGVTYATPSPQQQNLTVTATVVDSVAIKQQLDTFYIPVKANETAAQSHNFKVVANASNVPYTVWASVEPQNLDSAHNVYLAKKGSESIPFRAQLTGSTASNTVSVNPASIQTGSSETARPHTGRALDGNGVKGTNLRGTVYTLSLTEAKDLLGNQSPSEGNYTIQVTAHVEVGL